MPTTYNLHHQSFDQLNPLLHLMYQIALLFYLHDIQRQERNDWQRYIHITTALLRYLHYKDSMWYILMIHHSKHLRPKTM